MVNADKVNFAIFVSGGGTNCENIIRYFKSSERFRPVLVVSNKADAYALVRAERQGVPTAVVTRRQLDDEEQVMTLLREYGVEFVVLAGFLPLLPDYPSRAALSICILHCYRSLVVKVCGGIMYMKQ